MPLSLFVKEQKKYSFNALCSMFKSTAGDLIPIIRKLKEFGLLKIENKSVSPQNLSELADAEVVATNDNTNDYNYLFNFVGVVVVAGKTLKCYPKYLPDHCSPVAELKQILKVLEKASSKDQSIRMFSENNADASLNLLAVMLFLIHDYYENGIYANTEEIIEINGDGEINWNKTINETFTLISHNKPYYPYLLTRKRITDDCDFFKRLHEYVLTEVSKELQNADLLDLFELTEIELTDEKLDELGDKEYILYKIEKELNCQFNTRKQLVLKTIYAYIDRRGNLNDVNCISLFGTSSFNTVWERVCSDILDNQLQKPLSDLNLPVPVQKNSTEAKKTLKEIIEKPKWSATGLEANDTLIPDLVTITEDKFIIFDAKYYTPVLELGRPPEHQPGIESVTKQYLYQLAFQDFISKHGFAEVKNCFLMPTDQTNVQNMGTVTMKMFADLNQNLQVIEVRYIPASMAYEHYLSDKKIELSLLDLWKY
ncbi:MAG: LlaJI family restriction endonuclease [Succinimonas sp.]|nr:LlaJI family restriction endonuclease [Succinimonas sp.]